MKVALEALMKIAILAMVVSTASGCYFFEFFKSSPTSAGDDAGSTEPVLGQSLGRRAGGADEAALASLYGIPTTHPPAAVRPDPDLYARRLLLQYREEGSTVARQIGGIERYRSLLGGASEDFIRKPQEDYDATSLLATYKVAESICTGLVNPSEANHPGWLTILPGNPDEIDRNIRFLAQRFLGRPSDRIDVAIIDGLAAILETAKVGGAYTAESYVAVCIALSLDAESLFL